MGGCLRQSHHVRHRSTQGDHQVHRRPRRNLQPGGRALADDVARRDHRVVGVDLRVLESHLAACPRCQTYDARVSRGVLVLKNSGEIEPPRHLRHELQRRIAAANRFDFPLLPTYAGVLATLAVIVSVGLVLWDRQEPRIPTIVMDSAPATPLPAASLVRPATLEQPDVSLAVPAFGADWRAPGAEDDTYLVWPAQVR